VIVTLTPNPSIDRAIVIDALLRGEVHRATSSRIDPGGKGVNVGRALAAQGTATIAVCPPAAPRATSWMSSSTPPASRAAAFPSRGACG
jgi:1-phosphofructokinase